MGDITEHAKAAMKKRMQKIEESEAGKCRASSNRSLIARVKEGIVPLKWLLDGQDDLPAVEKNQLRERALLYVARPEPGRTC